MIISKVITNRNENKPCTMKHANIITSTVSACYQNISFPSLSLTKSS